MTDNAVESTTNNDANTALANEWVEHLKQQNKIRLMLLIAVCVGLAVSSLFLVNSLINNNALEARVAKQSASITELEASYADTSAKLVDANLQVVELNKSVAASNKKAKFLEQVKGDTASQLGVAEQIIDTQRQKIEILEAEFANSNELVSGLESQVASEQALKSKLEKKVAGITKSLNERTQAYNAMVQRQRDTRTEVDRLAQALEKAEGAHTLARQTLTVTKGELMRVKQELSVMRDQYETAKQEMQAQQKPVEKVQQVADDHHNLAIQPIIGQVPAEPATSSTANRKVVDPNALVLE